METPPHPAIDLSPKVYYQLLHTLTGLLPPPLDASPEALQAGNHAAIAKVAALLPIGGDEIDLAAQCIAARAQAEDVLRSLRQHAGDIGMVLRLNAQYGSMVRTSLSVHGRLMRVQALRRKREATEAVAAEDAWTQPIAEHSMLHGADPGAEPPQPQPPEAVPVEAVVQMIKKGASKEETNSHNMAFETWMSKQLRGLDAENPGDTGLRDRVRTALRDRVRTAMSGLLFAQARELGRAVPSLTEMAGLDPASHARSSRQQRGQLLP